MERKYKIILIVTGVLLLAGGVGFLIYGVMNNNSDSSGDENPGNDPDENPYLNGNNYQYPQNSGSTSDSANMRETGGAGSSWGSQITPEYNTENELSNPFSEVQGVMLYPKGIAQDGWGYTNIRTSAEVNNDQGWWDPSDNLITTINAGIPVGRVLSLTTGVYNGYPYQWFKVKLAEAVGGWFSDYTEGYVRADTVTFKPYSN